jgi:hypothetical protein
VQAKLGSLLTGIEFNFHKDTLWGRWATQSCSLEINLGETENITSLWFAARGDMDEALATISQVLEAFALRGIDLQLGEFFDPESARRSFQEWRGSVERFRRLKGIPPS